MTADEGTRMLSKEEIDCLTQTDCPQDSQERIKILIAEDDHTTRLLYDRGFFGQIFDKRMVISGKEAIQVYGEWRPDMIVLDIYLPEMTGFQVLKEIRATVGDRDTTIVMATALSGREDILSCMKLGIEGYIVKPFSCGEIAAKVLGYYARKEPERAKRAQARCLEIARQSRLQWLLDKKPAPTEEAAEAPEAAEAAEAASDAAAATDNKKGETL